MITLTILLLILGVILFVVCTGFTFLLDPIIAVLAVYGCYKLIAYLKNKKK